MLVAPLSQIDNCLTKAYDLKVTNQDAKPQLDTCKMSEIYQHTLDCGAAHRSQLTSVGFIPSNP